MKTRIIPAFLGSAAVTLGLFVIMEALVAFDGDVDLDLGDKKRFVDVIQDIEDTPPERLERKVEKPPEPETPPPDIETPQTQAANPDAMNVGAGAEGFAPQADTMGINLGPSADGDMLPLVLAPAQFPRRAQERGVSGYCQVSLTVLEDGTVDPDSVVGVEEEPKGYFCRAAIRAAQKYKYKPRVVNGKAQKVTNVQYRVKFELADE